MKITKILLLTLALFIGINRGYSDEVGLDAIKVNLIGKKTRVTFYFDEEVAYNINKLDEPFRVMMDFIEPVRSEFEKVKVFDMGYVKNVRSFFKDDEGAYFLDACVIELNRKCVVDMFWIGTNLHVDFVDVEELEREKKEEMLSAAKRMNAEELYLEGLALMKGGQFEKAQRKFFQSMQADETYLVPLEEMKKCKKLAKKKKKEVEKAAASFEKEMERRLKEERTLAAGLEKEITKKKLDRLSINMDATDLEQKGLIAYRNGEYEKAIEYWGKVMDLYPKEVRIARLIADARKRKKKKDLRKSQRAGYIHQSDGVIPTEDAHSKIIGDPRVEEFSDKVRLTFPVNADLKYRFASLTDPYRVMLYFKEKTFTMMSRKKDVEAAMVKSIRAYLTDSEKNSEDWKQISALIIDLSSPSRFNIFHEKGSLHIIFFKDKQ